MAALLQNYSLSEIFIFTILLALAIKSLISFFDWGYSYVYRIFNKQHSKINEKERLENRLQKGSQEMHTLKENQETTDTVLKELSTKIDMLIDSDKDAIKSYITKEHHYYCYQLGWIDDFSLDCLERRYQHYADYKGNSFISGLMEELRNLPNQNPWKNQK